MKKGYFDYNSTTPVDSSVQKVINEAMSEHFGNASSLHARGVEAGKIIEKSRKYVAGLIGAAAEEIYFTSGGTESNNWALRGLDSLKTGGKNHIISSVAEHSTVYETINMMSRCGWDVTWLPIDGRGLIEPEDLIREIRPETALISLMTANNETGALQDLDKISSAARKAGVLLHSDAVQAAGKIPLDVNGPAVDLLSLSAHKIYGPQGIGALYVRKGLTLSPLLYGGGQEKGRRSGTESVPLIAGFGEACRMAADGLEERERHLRDLKNVLYSELREKIQCMKLNGPLEHSLPNTLNLSFPGCESETLILDLDSAGFQVSGGAACGSAGRKRSRVLKAMGLKPVEIFSALRLSLGKETDEEDVLALAETLAGIVRKYI